MASAHKMKRTEQSLWRKNSQTMRQRDHPADTPPPLVVSDILPPSPAVGNSIAHVETPVPIPVPPLRTLNSNFTTGPALKRKALATSDKILQAQQDWEARQRTAMENKGPAVLPSNNTPSAHKMDLTRPPKRDEARGAAAEAIPGAQRLSEEVLMQRMTELNRSASTGSKARRTSRSQLVEPPAPASASETASVSPTRPLTATDQIDAIDLRNTQGNWTGVQENSDNMSYYLYTEDDGTVRGTQNAPFPPGKERYDHPEPEMGRPFICPVRDCRALAISMKQIAAHFHGKHSRTLFNDNGDGTFSKVRDYANKDDSSPGIIVSRNPISPGAPPPATPEYSERQKMLLSKRSPPMPNPRASVIGAAPGYILGGTPGYAPSDVPKRTLRTETNNDVMDERLAKRPKKTPVPLPLPVQAPVLPPSPPSQPLEQPPLTETLRFLHRFLSPNQQVPSRPDILALSKYERVRNLPASWIDYHIDKTIDPLHYACVLAYLVGTAEEKNPCRKWKGVSRLSDPCVGLPASLPAEARAAFSKSETCMACQYQYCYYRTKNECDWAKNENRVVLDGVSEEADATAQAEAEAISQSKHESASDNRAKVVVVDDGYTDDDYDIVSEGLSLSKREPEEVPIRTSQKKSSPPISAAALASAAAQKLSTSQMEEVEEMEDWEVAPGTIKDEVTNMNIGFSNAYMSDQHPITISPGIGFNVLILKPGHSYHWPEEVSKVRTCSVSTGKISVKTGSNQTFKLGPNGVVVIRPGQSCMVSNRLYTDAVLHCTTFEDDFQTK
ncbi:hypothetical protein LI328DRAFT_131452 [Trichoderma asperelloides]|nr:hypothetical protein LI328DRAFT_131452 [Trichoderma asperelloides]